ncbi:MAG: ATP-binding cassette domain-containing protein [Armatimonadota bacterium]|nr:ATP-binding cassette domain-containing protein [Armatimonadota bacterium]
MSGLSKHYIVSGGLLRRHILRAVDGVSFTVSSGETLGVVGESGSGKSTLGRCLLRLEEPSEGVVKYRGIDITGLPDSSLRPLRRHLQMVFQDPADSLNPRMTVGTAVLEPILLHGLARGVAARRRVIELFELVGLSEEHVARYPHQLSGGQQQRVAIARALASNPQFVVLDEPTSALDVSVQAQLLNLLRALQRRLGLSYLFISHDLSVVSYMARRVVVLYLGRVVEEGPTRALFDDPKHPYTRTLLSAVPANTPWEQRHRIIPRGEPASPLARPAGCPFSPRCPWAVQRCHEEPQALQPVGPDRQVACWRSIEGKIVWTRPEA